RMIIHGNVFRAMHKQIVPGIYLHLADTAIFQGERNDLCGIGGIGVKLSKHRHK
ncbi:MAG: hypothetical protein QG588_1295, partial [Candidatus Poribacteria bacterium]|nr:hypothetical protein [Candidatus Poribacteria bacterium]